MGQILGMLYHQGGHWGMLQQENKIKREGWAELCYTQTLICLYTWVHTTSCMGSMFISKGFGLSVAPLLRWPKKLPFMTFGPPQVHKPLGWYSTWALRKSRQIMQAITQAITICYDNPSRQLLGNSLLHICCKSVCTQQNMCIYVYYSCTQVFTHTFKISSWGWAGPSSAQARCKNTTQRNVVWSVCQQ